MQEARLRELAEAGRALLALEAPERSLARAVAAALRPQTRYHAGYLAMVEGDEALRVRLGVVVPPGEQTEAVLAPRTSHALRVDDLAQLAAAAQRRGGVHLLEGSHPLVAQLVAKGALWESEPLASGWHPASLAFEVLELPGSSGITGALFLDQPVCPDPPSADEVAYLDAVAQLLALGILHEQLHSRAQAQLRILEAERARLEGLFRASGHLRRARALEEVLQEAADAVTAAGGFGRAAIYLRDGDAMRLWVTSGVEPAEEARLRAAGPIPIGLFAAVMAPQMRISRSYLFRHRVYPLHPELARRMSIPKVDQPVDEHAWQPEDTLTIPLLDGERLLGVLSVDNPLDGHYPDLAQIQALEFFADQAAIAVAQVRTIEQLRVDATTDALTGLANRRRFEVAARAVLADATVERAGVALLVADLDRFKVVNDERGHTVGDRALQVVAHAMGECLLARDALARWGGEEFVALARGIDADGARRLGEAMRRSVVELARQELGFDLSVSIGAAVAGPDVLAVDLDVLFDAADEALYRAKRQGRNRVEVVVLGEDGTEAPTA